MSGSMKSQHNAAKRDMNEIRAKHADSRDALQEVAQKLGHSGMALHRTVSGARYFTSCDCGFVSSTQIREKDALAWAIKHVERSMKEWAATGRPLPKNPPTAKRPESKMRRKNPHYNEWYFAMQREKRAQMAECPESDKETTSDTQSPPSPAAGTAGAAGTPESRSERLGVSV